MSSDLIQILLKQPGAWGLLSCALLFSLTWLIWRYFWATVSLIFRILKEVRKPFIPWNLWSAFKILTGGSLFLLFNNEISDYIQYVEQRYLNPVYVSNDTSSFAVKCFETELSKNLSSEQMNTLVRWTDSIANDVGSTRLALYEVYNSECALNPFAVNTRLRNGKIDTIAASIIQFTAAGVTGLSTMREVKDAVIKKDLEFLMRLSHTYMIRAAKGNALPSACNVYTAVFMPKFVGGDMSTVLASKWSSRPDYYFENKGLDGHYLLGDKIMTGKGDGEITIHDLHLHLELKKSQLLKKYETGKN